MRARQLLILALVPTMAACTSIDGTYRPACVAFEGETIQLRDGRFTWQRFTDERHIDADGKPVDPFPDFPKQGSYALDKSMLTLSVDGSAEPARYYLARSDGDIFLVEDNQHESYLANANLPECVLKRDANAVVPTANLEK